MTKEELENEAKEKFRQKYNCYPRNKSWFTEGYLAGAEPREKRIAELEKENAELKEQLRLAKEMPYSAVKEFAEEKTQDQLTKAKKIIKNLMVFAEMDDREYEKEYKEAEQFLSEVEK